MLTLVLGLSALISNYRDLRFFFKAVGLKSCPKPGTLALSGETNRRVLLASSGKKPRMRPCTLQCTRQSSLQRGYCWHTAAGQELHFRCVSGCFLMPCGCHQTHLQYLNLEQLENNVFCFSKLCLPKLKSLKPESPEDTALSLFRYKH